MRPLASLAMVIGCLLGSATPSTAQPTADDIIAALSEDQIYRPPDAPAYFDEARVRAALDPAVRILMVPRGGLEEQDDQIDRWVEDNGIERITVNGLSVYGRGGFVWPDNLLQLRQVTAYSDITRPLLTAIRAADEAGDQVDTRVEPTASIPPTEAQVAEVVARLTESPVYNAPGCEFPIDPAVIEHATAQKLALRIAAFPAVSQGAAVVNYAPALAERFPDEVIFVVHGAWLDVAGPDQALVESVRDYAYGAQWRINRDANDVVGVAVQRLGQLAAGSRFGEPQPGWEPSFFRRSAVEIVVAVTVVSAVLFLVAVLVLWRDRRRLEASAAQLALRSASGSAMASIGRLEAHLLAVEMKSERAGAEMAERLATARALYDRAFTAAAMREVKAIADEGLALGRSAAGDFDGVAATQPRKRRRRRARASRRVTAVPASSALTLGLVGSYLLFILVTIFFAVTDERPPGDQARISELAKEVVAGLQQSAVYEAPGLSGGPDPVRVRELIGRRPLVVARLSSSGEQSYLSVCDDIAQVRVTELVVVFGVTKDGRFDGDVCFGDSYSDRSFYSNDAPDIMIDMKDATRFRQSTVDAFDTLEALVRAYDVTAVEIHDPEPVPRRGVGAPPPPPGSTSAGPLFAIGGIPLAMVVLVTVIRRQGYRWIARGQGAQAAHTRSDEIEARLNRLADAVLHPGRPTDEHEARRQAELAEKYVLFLRDREAGDADDERLSEMEREVTR